MRFAGLNFLTMGDTTDFSQIAGTSKKVGYGTSSNIRVWLLMRVQSLGKMKSAEFKQFNHCARSGTRTSSMASGVGSC